MCAAGARVPIDGLRQKVPIQEPNTTHVTPSQHHKRALTGMPAVLSPNGVTALWVKPVNSTLTASEARRKRNCERGTSELVAPLPPLASMLIEQVHVWMSEKKDVNSKVEML